MKRNIIFLTVLTVLTLTIMTTEFIYTKSFKEKANALLENCIGLQDYNNFCLNVGKVEKFVSDKKDINLLFYPRDIIQKISVCIKRADTYATEGEKAEALAELEEIQQLIKRLC